MAHRLRARHEERDRLIPGERVQAADVRAGRRPERRHTVLMLGGEPERRPARDQHAEPGRAGEQLAHDRRRVVHALEVVQQQQGRPLSQSLFDAVQCRAAALAERQGVRDRRSDVCRIVQRAQVDEVPPVGQRPPELPGGLEREPRLSGSARTGERDEADVRAAEQPGHRGQLQLTADERRQRRGQVALHRANTALRRERRILAQDRPFQPLQLLTWLDAEVFAERAPRLAIHVERLCLPAAAVEREHELAAEPLTVRVLGDQALQLGHEHVVCALIELCVDPALDGGEPKIVEPSRFCGRKRRVDSREGRPAPELERGCRSVLLVLEEAGRGRARRPRPATDSRRRPSRFGLVRATSAGHGLRPGGRSARARADSRPRPSRSARPA